MNRRRFLSFAPAVALAVAAPPVAAAALREPNIGEGVEIHLGSGGYVRDGRLTDAAIVVEMGARDVRIIGTTISNTTRA